MKKNKISSSILISIDVDLYANHSNDAIVCPTCLHTDENSKKQKKKWKTIKVLHACRIYTMYICT